MSKFSRSEITVLAILATVHFAHIVDFMLMMPLGPQLMRLLKIDSEQFSLLVSAYTFWAGASSLFSAFVLDRFDRKRALLFVFLGFAIGTTACGLAERYESLLWARSLTGIFGGVLGSLVFAIVGDVFAPEKRGTATGIVMGAFSLASIFGVPFSLYLASAGSWQSPLLALGGFCLLILPLIALKTPSLTHHIASETNWRTTWIYLKSVPFQKRPRLAILLLAAIILGQFSVIAFLSTALVVNLGMREDQLSLTYLLSGAIALFTSPLFGRLCDKVGAIPVLLVATPLSILPFLLITHLGRTSLFWTLAACSVFFFLMGGRMVPTMTVVTGSVLPRNRGAFMSLTTALQQFAAAAAAMIAGKIVVMGSQGELLNYNRVGYFAAALTVLAAFIAFLLRKEPAQIS